MRAVFSMASNWKCDETTPTDTVMMGTNKSAHCPP